VDLAIRTGYRNFDCAESYGTTRILSEAIAASEIDRDEFDITYKFNLKEKEEAGALKDRLSEVAGLFDGYFDNLLIHNMDASQQTIKSAWTAMNQLKGEDVALAVGLGNLKESDAPLVEELKGEAGIDVVENSLSSVLANAELMNMIKGTGAKLMYYDVVKTAEEIGIKSPAGIRALMYSINGQMEGASNMILSSGSVKRNVENFRGYGSGDARDYMYDGSDIAMEGHIKTIFDWQKEQSVIQENQAGFALSGGVAGYLGGIAYEAASTRAQIQNAAPGGQVTPAFIRQWLNDNTVLSNAVQDSVRVPARKGLKKRYLGMPWGKITAALFGAKNCDWKWAIELVQLMTADIEGWMATKGEMGEIVG